jgi:hypothetical protein
MAPTPEGEDFLNEILSGREVLLFVDSDGTGVMETVVSEFVRVEDGYFYVRDDESPMDPLGFDFSIIKNVTVLS